MKLETRFATYEIDPFIKVHVKETWRGGELVKIEIGRITTFEVDGTLAESFIRRLYKLITEYRS